MSWQLLDGPSARSHTICTIPDHLRKDSKTGKLARSLMASPVDPDALLSYIDGAISSLEYAQATHRLLGIDATLAVDRSSRCSFYSDTSKTSPLSNVKYDQTITPFTINAVNTDGPSQILAPDALPSDSEALKIEEEQVNGMIKEGTKMENDARGADEAYRAACSAISEGSADLALSLLQVAYTKCPPNKHAALAKVQRLTAVAMELLHKKSTVLTTISADDDNSFTATG